MRKKRLVRFDVYCIVSLFFFCAFSNGIFLGTFFAAKQIPDTISLDADQCGISHLTIAAAVAAEYVFVCVCAYDTLCAAALNELSDQQHTPTTDDKSYANGKYCTLDKHTHIL